MRNTYASGAMVWANACKSSWPAKLWPAALWPARLWLATLWPATLWLQRQAGWVKNTWARPVKVSAF